MFKASGTRLPVPGPPGKSSVTRQVKNKELTEVSFFSFFFPPPDAVLRSHHFRSEVIYLARTLKVRRSSLSWVPVLIIGVFRSQQGGCCIASPQPPSQKGHVCFEATPQHEFPGSGCDRFLVSWSRCAGRGETAPKSRLTSGTQPCGGCQLP